MGDYGVFYQNVSFEDARKGKGVWLLASAPTDTIKAAQAVELVNSSDGAYVFHDPNEFGMYPHWGDATTRERRVICIRETGLSSMAHGKFIPHPYVRVCKDTEGTPRFHALSVARISAVKNSQWILEANQSLPDWAKVKLYGELNRMWWNFNIKPKHPDWPMPEAAGFPRTYGAAANLCQSYKFMVDLTIFKNDGGGTQYSLLEAMDAGAVPVMTKDWCSYPGSASQFGYQVRNASDLIQFLKQKDDPLRESFRRCNYGYLDTVHGPKRIAQQYANYLGVKFP